MPCPPGSGPDGHGVQRLHVAGDVGVAHVFQDVLALLVLIWPLPKGKPGELKYGSGGSGSPPHLAAEVFKSMTTTDILHVPYKGGGQAVNDLLAGQIDMVVSDALPVSQHIRTGRLRALAITSAKRSSMTPDIPTFAEAGLDGLIANNWWGVFLPTGTPKAVVEKAKGALPKPA